MTRKQISTRTRFEVFKFRYFCGVCWTKIREMEGGK